MNLFGKKDAAVSTLRAKVSALSKQGYEMNNPPPEWQEQIRAENDAVNAVLEEIIDGMPTPDPRKLRKLTKDEVWIWGGPTPSWGGSTDKDTLVRATDSLGADQVVYVYGPVNAEMLALHQKYRRALCQITNICRSPEAQPESDMEASENLSRLSLQFPNFVGGIIDDLSPNMYKSLTVDHVKEVYLSLKKHNSDLNLYGVTYTRDLDKDFTPFLPYVDVVNLWVWSKEDLLKLDADLEKCRQALPGKPIVMGFFMHDYGLANTVMPAKLFKYQLNKAHEYVTDGRIDGIVVLGDREIYKWPENAQILQDYLHAQWQ